MARYHIHPDLGTILPCQAKKDNCPFGSSDEHYDSVAAAETAIALSQIEDPSLLEEEDSIPKCLCSPVHSSAELESWQPDNVDCPVHGGLVQNWKNLEEVRDYSEGSAKWTPVSGDEAWKDIPKSLKRENFADFLNTSPNEYLALTEVITSEVDTNGEVQEQVSLTYPSHRRTVVRDNESKDFYQIDYILSYSTEDDSEYSPWTFEADMLFEGAVQVTPSFD